jgi:hypothetical protein
MPKSDKSDLPDSLKIEITASGQRKIAAAVRRNQDLSNNSEEFLPRRVDYLTYDREHTEFESLHFPGLGNVNVTFEVDPRSLDSDPHVTISVDFPLSKLNIVDRVGNTHHVLPSDD